MEKLLVSFALCFISVAVTSAELAPPPPPAPPAPPVPPSPYHDNRMASVEPCEDTSKFCPYFSMSGYCSNQAFEAYMKIMCKKTCGKCGVCEDVSARCANFATFCNLESMKKHCKVTCGLCNVAPEPEIPMPPYF